MLLKARVKLNCKRLYAADGRAVKELLKLARILYNAHQYKASEEDSNEPDVAMTNKAKDVKGARALAPDITESGAKL
jgi:clusterin-associated protein 1